MKVAELGTPNLMDVPEGLRMLADKMVSGEVKPSGHCIVVSEGEDGELSIYGYGACGSTSNEVGTLHMAAMQLALM